MKRATVIAVTAAVAFSVTSLLPRRADAGDRATSLTMLNLDRDAASQRFTKLRDAIDSALRARRAATGEYGIVATRLASTHELETSVGADCEFFPAAIASASKALSKRDSDFLLIYCADKDAEHIAISLYDLRDLRRPKMRVMLDPFHRAVGKDLLGEIGRAMLHLADSYFSP